MTYLLKQLGINIQPCINSSDHPGNHRNSMHINYLHHFLRVGVQLVSLKQIADTMFITVVEQEKFISIKDALAAPEYYQRDEE